MLYCFFDRHDFLNTPELGILFVSVFKGKLVYHFIHVSHMDIIVEHKKKKYVGTDIGRRFNDMGNSV